MTLTLYDEFAGCGGSSQGAASVPGVELILAANHDKWAIDSHAANFPAADHFLGDVRSIDLAKFPRADIFWASPSCFPAGTLILTKRGLLPIEDVRVGDEAFTHRRRWRPVTAVMSREADTVVVKASGLAAGIETTNEHPFYTRRRVPVWDNANRRYEYTYGDPGWTEAANLERLRHLVATPDDFGEQLPVPGVPGRGVTFDADFWWLIGRWLGDGMLRIQEAPARAPAKPQALTPRTQPAGSTCVMCPNPARPRKNNARTGLTGPYCSNRCRQANQPKRPTSSRYDVSICCGHHEADELGSRLAKIAPVTGVRATGGELRWQRKEHRTATWFTASHRDLVPWIAEHFGRYATGKTVPTWALTMPRAWREALLDGYLSADGCIRQTTYLSTVSKRLALGMRMLANSLGNIANIKGPFTRQPRTIEGRSVTERPTWSVSWITDGPSKPFSVSMDGLRWAPVRRVEPTGRRAEVFNISVAEDESYLADGMVVHNCPPFSSARGVRRDFDRDTQGVLFETEGDAKVTDAKRGRLLMHEVVRYLEAMDLRGEPVLAGVVENVTEARKWDMWQAWIDRIKGLGYDVRVIAVNSMHARPVRTHRAPQSRDRLFVAYWLKSLGRAPDWNKWLRPAAWCPSCGEIVAAVQAFKDPRADMGRYGRHGQYVFRCPKISCRHAVVEPEVLPAAAAIDWDDLGTPIGDRVRPMKPATRARVSAGLRKYARPITLDAAGHTFERRPAVRTRPVDWPVTTQSTTATKALACPPLIVPAGGTWRNDAMPVTEPLGARTARENDGLAVPPFLVPLRSGRPRTIDPSVDPVATMVANGGGHALAVPDAAMITRHFGTEGDPGFLSTPPGEPIRTLTSAGHQSLSTWAHLMVPYYGNGYARPVEDPAGTFTSKDRYGLASGGLEIDVDDVLFRMLKPAEIARAMAFADDYIVLGAKKDKIRLLGNAVTPPVAEVIVSALVEAITGEELEQAA